MINGDILPCSDDTAFNSTITAVCVQCPDLTCERAYWAGRIGHSANTADTLGLWGERDHGIKTGGLPGEVTYLPLQGSTAHSLALSSEYHRGTSFLSCHCNVPGKVGGWEEERGERREERGEGERRD